MNGLAIVVALQLVAQAERVDVALRLRSFEAAYATLPRTLPSEQRIAIETDFDRACATAAMAGFADAIVLLDALTARVRRFPAVEPTAADPTKPPLIAASCTSVVWPARMSPLRIRLEGATQFREEDDLVRTLNLELRRVDESTGLAELSDSARILALDVDLKLRVFDRSMTEFDLPREAWPKQPGRYALVTTDPWSELASIQFMTADPDTTSAALRTRLVATSQREHLSDELKRAIMLCDDRCSKLRSAWNGADTFVLVEDLSTYAEILEREVASIERGVDPYERTAGEMWRALRLDHGKQVLYRIAAPAGVKSIAKLPVIIALHAHGGDENMFFHAYGRGALRRLVETRHFLAVTPSTLGLMRHPDRLFSLLQHLERDYPIDRDRIHLLGHSSGADLARAVSARFPSAFASIAEFAGLSLLPDPPVPSLVFEGRDDTLEGSSMLSATLAGLDRRTPPAAPHVAVELRSLPNRGHTLMVGDHLEEAVDFLLAHPRPVK